MGEPLGPHRSWTRMKEGKEGRKVLWKCLRQLSSCKVSLAGQPGSPLAKASRHKNAGPSRNGPTIVCLLGSVYPGAALGGMASAPTWPWAQPPET